MSQKEKVSGVWRKKLIIVSLVGALALPFLAFSSSKKNLHVDSRASGVQNGSTKHPFKTIRKAIEEADGPAKIHVAKGEYKENITLEKGIELFGEDENKTIIKARHDDEPVVVMKQHTKINKFTIRGGEDGVRIKNNAEAEIIKCKIKDNDEDGVDIDEGEVTDARRVLIIGSEIRDNGMAGIYSKSRRVVIMDSEIEDNWANGIDLEAGSSAWIAGNKISGNRKNGMKFRLFGSNIWTKGNEIRENKFSGIEVISDGKAGRINIEKSKIVINGKYAIAKIQLAGTTQAENLWNARLTFSGLPNNLWGNKLGNISSVLFIL